METKDELQTQPEQKETLKEIYQPPQEFSCDLGDVECTKRMIQSFGDCV
jgi:hypothetical protein